MYTLPAWKPQRSSSSAVYGVVVFRALGILPDLLRNAFILIQVLFWSEWDSIYVYIQEKDISLHYF